MSLLIFPFFSPVDHRKILKEPDKRLRIVSKKVTNFDKQTREITLELISVTKKVDKPWKVFLGMAAPQIGYSQRIVILRKSFRNYKFYINPEILDRKWFIPALTACYSVKGIYITTIPLFMKIRFQDLKGNTHEESLMAGFAATMQQEIDHINGKLISD